MKLIKNITLISFLSFVWMLTACPGDDDNGKSEEEIARDDLAVTWKVNSVSSNPAGSFGQDFESVTLKFNSNGTYELSKPASVLFPALPANRTDGTWVLKFDSKQVVFDEGTPDSKTIEWETLNATNFIFHFSGSIPLKYTESATITYNMVP